MPKDGWSLLFVGTGNFSIALVFSVHLNASGGQNVSWELERCLEKNVFLHVLENCLKVTEVLSPRWRFDDDVIQIKKQIWPLNSPKVIYISLRHVAGAFLRQKGVPSIF